MLAGSNAVYLCTATAVLEDHDVQGNKGKSTAAVDANGASEFTDEQPQDAFLEQDQQPMRDFARRAMNRFSRNKSSRVFLPANQNLVQ